jgi:hypothetical protein
MQKMHRKFRLELKWNKVPRRRRQAYVYILLLLGAIVGNDITSAIADESEDVSSDTPSHYEHVKDRANLLYR